MFSTTLMLLRNSWLRYTLTVLLLTAVAGISCAQVTVNGSSANLIYDGIDVSSYQKDIDWSATAKDKNIKFVYVKATEGATYRSRHYQYNIENARQYGINVGAYHFFRPNVPVEKQFRNFTSVVKKEDQDLIPLIDVEVRGNNLTVKALVDSVLAFADKLEDYYGCKPMIYTGHAFYNSYLSGKIPGYPLFIARYSKVEPRLTGGANWVLWQFSEKGVIAGIDHAVDLCRFNKGCGLKDILISGRKVRSRTQSTAPRKEKKPEPAAEEKKEVKPNPEQEKLDKEARKRAEKRKAEEKKEAERLAKQKEKLRKLKEKEQKEAAKQEQKRREKAAKEARKRAEKEEKMRQEQAKRDQKAREEFLKKKDKERQEAKERQEEQAKADRQRKQKQEEQARKREEMKRAQEKAAKKQSQNQKAKNQGRRVNQSSPDNDDIYY